MVSIWHAFSASSFVLSCLVFELKLLAATLPTPNHAGERHARVGRWHRGSNPWLWIPYICTLAQALKVDARARYLVPSCWIAASRAKKHDPPIRLHAESWAVCEQGALVG